MTLNKIKFMEYCKQCEEGLTSIEFELCIDCRQDNDSDKKDYCSNCGYVGSHSNYCKNRLL